MSPVLREVEVVSLAGAGISKPEYYRLREQIKAIKSDVILLYVEAYSSSWWGATELHQAIIASTIPIHVFIADVCSGPVYAAIAAAKHIAMNKPGTVGNIGYVAVLVDRTKQAEKDGVKTIVVASEGATYKGLGLRDEVSKEHAEYMQGLVNGAAKLQTELIKSARPKVNPATFDGRLFIAEKAKQLGLVDSISSLEEFYNKLVTGSI